MEIVLLLADGLWNQKSAISDKLQAVTAMFEIPAILPLLVSYGVYIRSDTSKSDMIFYVSVSEIFNKFVMT